MSEEQIERVARAIAECDRPSSISIATWWHLRGEDFTEKARVAIAAMPTAPVQSEDRLREIERDAEGRVLICTGCGTVETVASIRRISTTAFTCCPERKMVRATYHWSADIGCGLERKDTCPRCDGSGWI